MSRLALGCASYGSKSYLPWVISEQDAQVHYRKAFESGITFFDTANSYSTGLSEEILGRAIKRYGTGRDRTVIATKVHNVMGPDLNQRGLSRKHIHHSIDASLKRLGTDYIDLYQIHRLDHATPMEEILEGLDQVVRAGTVLYIGASSMHAWEFAKLQNLAKQHALPSFVTMQTLYNLLYREEDREMLPMCADQGVGVLPYSPLARGLLAGSRNVKTERSGIVKDFARTIRWKDCLGHGRRPWNWLATALLMAVRGADVIVQDVLAEDAVQTADEIVAMGRKAMPAIENVADINATKRIVEKAIQELGRIDILVNNAGVADEIAVEEITETHFQRVFDINVKGTFFCGQAVIPSMKVRGSGKIVNVSSIWGMSDAATASHYCASKAAILGLTKAWTKELAPWGIQVGPVGPKLRFWPS